MGQTLTHGIYLPEEGERNCYSGLAANWSILDGAVGTIAEHTSALAGKAPLVHTHTKSDITDFPAYGTTAGTICEGNDSRLSDARTPVAHTHTKSDVTDLFNSTNTWSGDNTYSKTVAIERNTDTGNFLALKNTVAELGSTPASATPVTIAYRDKNNDNLGYMGVYYDTDGSNHFRLYVRNKFTSGSPSTSGTADYAYFGLKLNADKSREGILKASFRPYDNNAYDLGSSSYQWNNLYAKNYYYNGTAWGLDKANVWTNFNRINGYRLEVKSSSQEIGVIPSSNQWNGFQFTDKNNTRTVSFEHGFLGSGETRFGISMVDNFASNGSDSDVRIEFLRLSTYSGGSAFVIGADARPMANNAYDLGTSTNKWKTLNGINPGALGIPSGVRQSISEYITNVNLGWNNQVTAVRDGYIVVTINDAAGNSIYLFNNTKQYSNGSYGNGSQGTGRLSCTLPVNEGDAIIIFIKAAALSDVFSAYLYVMNGNVNALPSS